MLFKKAMESAVFVLSTDYIGLLLNMSLMTLQIVELLKNRPLWLSDCRRMEVVGTCTTASGGLIELLYMQVMLGWWRHGAAFGMYLRNLFIFNYSFEKDVSRILKLSGKLKCLHCVLQFYAPTTLALPRDFYTLRYTTVLDDRNVVVSMQCHRGLCYPS